ncbi:MAG: hypothetical protein HUU17_06270 [Chthonomonadales bacterium]|nr:hypothetical protein [Chthonomonadales bacterium]
MGQGKGKGWRRDKKMQRYTCIRCGRKATTRVITPIMGTPEVPVNAGLCKRGCKR